MERCVEIPWEEIEVNIDDNDQIILSVSKEQAEYISAIRKKINECMFGEERIRGFDIAEKIGVPYEDIDFVLWLMDITGEVINLSKNNFACN